MQGVVTLPTLHSRNGMSGRPVDALVQHGPPAHADGGAAKRRPRNAGQSAAGVAPRLQETPRIQNRRRRPHQRPRTTSQG